MCEPLHLLDVSRCCVHLTSLLRELLAPVHVCALVQVPPNPSNGRAPEKDSQGEANAAFRAACDKDDFGLAGHRLNWI